MTINNKLQSAQKAVAVVMIIFAFCFAIFMIVVMIEMWTGETMRTEKVKCIDKNYNEFVDEYCYDEVKCGIISKAIEKERCYG